MKKVKHIATQMACFCIMVGLTGCASLSMRSAEMADRHPTKIYPATVADSKIITWPIWFPVLTAMDRYKPDAQESMILFAWPFAVLDLPLALIVDTIYLPMDLRRRTDIHADNVNEQHEGANNESGHVRK